MPLQPLAIFGAGGHAKEVAELVRDLNAVSPQWHLLGLLADAGATAFYPAALPILGDAQWLSQHPETWVVVAVGAGRHGRDGHCRGSRCRGRGRWRYDELCCLR